ncbi:MAG: VRR-NUC domain-containing protein [Tissierellia bacterium]|nr:VRR-NUC domain-containing protein [Tissierellia bacterium]
MREVPEKKIEKTLRLRMKKLGGRCFKFVSPGNNGVPDRICIFPSGQLVFVELKRPGGKLSNIQKVQIKRLLDLNQKVEVIENYEDLDLFFETWR